MLESNKEMQEQIHTYEAELAKGPGNREAELQVQLKQRSYSVLTDIRVACWFPSTPAVVTLYRCDRVL